MKFSELLPLITPRRKVLLLIFVLLLLGSGLALLNPWIAGQFTGLLIGNGESVFSNINYILIAWLGLLGFKSLLSFATRYLIGATGETITASLRTRLYDHLQALPLSYHQQQRSGDLLALLSDDAAVISAFVTNTLVQLLPLFITLGGAFV
ncbi:MAG: hypothetical protein IMF09_08300, partial [Proteobacteria bacterium]|nr:hypothetical protein [Pseudomonadota bacterium]